MSSLLTFEKKYQVGISDVDFTQTLKLSTLFIYFQEIANMHSEGVRFSTPKFLPVMIPKSVRI